QGIINIDPRRGTSRTDWHFSLEDAFAEVKLEDVNSNYDAVSLRVGIQPFVSDFRGFIFTDNNLGARLFGAFRNNRYQFNLAYFADSGDGPCGRINPTTSDSFLLGTDTRNPIAAQRTRVRAHMAADEASMDKDYRRYRGSFFCAAGDKCPA